MTDTHDLTLRHLDATRTHYRAVQATLPPASDAWLIYTDVTQWIETESAVLAWMTGLALDEEHTHA